MGPGSARAMAPGFSGPASIALRRSRRARFRSASVLSLPRRTSSSSALVSSTVAETPKSASIRTRSRFSRSSALSPRMSAPTSVSAICLMRDQRLCRLVAPQSAWLHRFGNLPPQRSPRRRRASHSPESASTQIPNSQSQSRAAVRPAGRVFRPSCAVRVTGRGRSSSEYSSTATIPPPPPGSRYRYSPGWSQTEARPSPSKWSVSVRCPAVLDNDHRLRASLARTQPLEDDRPAVLHHRLNRPGYPSRRVHPAEQPARRCRHPGAISSARSMPPRKGQRQRPSTATVTRRTRPSCRPKTAGRWGPRRPSWA